LRRRPCASLALHLHQVEQGTFTPKLSNMFGTPKNWASLAAGPLFVGKEKITLYSYRSQSQDQPL
jgi:hypothetical protein